MMTKGGELVLIPFDYLFEYQLSVIEDQNIDLTFESLVDMTQQLDFAMVVY